MKYLHQPFKAKSKDKIVVSFDRPTRVMLIRKDQFEKYRGGRTYQYRGGQAELSPAEFEVPQDGIWHAVIEEGPMSNPFSVKGSAKLVRPRPRTLNGPEQMETHEHMTEYDDTLE